MKIRTNIVLIGFMGAGKTEVGKILANNKGFNFIDLDCLIEAQEGMNITEIFKQKGESYFRNLETEILKKIDNDKTDVYKLKFAEKCAEINNHESKNWVISTGGGMPAFNGNIKVFKNIGIILYLKASPKTIYDRIKSEVHRPVLGGSGFTEETVAEKLKEREKFYEQADIVIYTEGLTASAVAEEIGIFLNKNKN